MHFGSVRAYILVANVRASKTVDEYVFIMFVFCFISEKLSSIYTVSTFLHLFIWRSIPMVGH